MRVDIDDLSFKYRGRGETRKIFDGASVSFSSGNFYALMGPSG